MSVDHPLVPVKSRRTTKSLEIGPCTGFGISLTPTDLSTQGTRQKIGALCFGAPPQERVAKHFDSEGVVVAHYGYTATSELFHENYLVGLTQSGTAVLLWPRDPKHSVGKQCRPPTLHKLVGLFARCDGAQTFPIGRQVFRQKPAHAFAEHLTGWVF